MSDNPREEQRESLVATETIGSVLWFLMDGFWMLNFASAAKALVLPTLLVNLFVFRYARESFTQFAVVAAMNSWLLMNAFWMFADLDKDPRPMAAARVMFFIGIAFLGLAVGRGAFRPQGLTSLMAHFRRLRI